MARRRRNSMTAEAPKRAFTPGETTAVENAIKQLYRRSLYHLVAPQFKIPDLIDLYRSLIPARVWEQFDYVNKVMVTNNNQYWRPQYDLQCQFNTGDGVRGVINLSAREFIADPSKIDGATKAGTMDEQWADLAAYTVACRAYHKKWLDVWNTFQALNKDYKRATAAFHWPCVTILMKLGGVDPGNLNDVQRPGTIDAGLTVQLRDTNAFVVQHAMLPKIEGDDVGVWAGDVEKLAAQVLMKVEPARDVLGDRVWPLQD